LQQIEKLENSVRLGPSTEYYCEEAVARDIPWIRLEKLPNSIGYGINQMRFQAS
jgi:cyanophycin synthetase